MACTNFVYDRLRLNKKNKNFTFYFVLSSACTNFALTFEKSTE